MLLNPWLQTFTCSIRRLNRIVNKRKKANRTSAVTAELLEDRTLLSTVAPSAPDLLAAHDSGSSNSDDITNNNTPAFLGAAEVGSTVEV